jgi:hypothetical protein
MCRGRKTIQDQLAIKSCLHIKELIKIKTDLDIQVGFFTYQLEILIQDLGNDTGILDQLSKGAHKTCSRAAIYVAVIAGKR